MNCDCEICQVDQEFAFDRRILEELCNGRLAIFAGAGVSTESPQVLKHTFYDEVASDAGSTAENLTFPQMMSALCKQPNGRYRMLNILRNRLDYIESFDELYNSATRFHRSLATIHHLRTIVTTNWDTYFEDQCGATPFVYDGDLAFWGDATRRVLKIHGTVNSYGSIVATEEEYDLSTSRLEKGIIGATLKTILAHDTVVFCGYSMRDRDFQSLYGFIRQQMGELHRQPYVVTPFKEEAAKFSSEGLIPIVTSGQKFLSTLKQHLVSESLMISDDLYYFADAALSEITKEHDQFFERVNLQDHPQAIFCACYQDGFIHALQRMITMRKTGQYSAPCRASHQAEAYNKIKKEKVRRRRYDDIAYIEGYINGMTAPYIMEKLHEFIDVPLYYIPGRNNIYLTFDQYMKDLEFAPDAHKMSYQWAVKYLARLRNPNTVVHHPPWL